jgi:hypothetical protein
LQNIHHIVLLEMDSKCKDTLNSEDHSQMIMKSSAEGICVLRIQVSFKFLLIENLELYQQVYNVDVVILGKLGFEKY